MHISPHSPHSVHLRLSISGLGASAVSSANQLLQRSACMPTGWLLALGHRSGLFSDLSSTHRHVLDVHVARYISYSKVVWHTRKVVYIPLLVSGSAGIWFPKISHPCRKLLLSTLRPAGIVWPTRLDGWERGEDNEHRDLCVFPPRCSKLLAVLPGRPERDGGGDEVRGDE